jgi:YD repeat-containing protein
LSICLPIIANYYSIKTESFDAAGNLVTLNDPIDSTTRTNRYEYDQRKRQTKITDAIGLKVKIEMNGSPPTHMTISTELKQNNGSMVAKHLRIPTIKMAIA